MSRQVPTEPFIVPHQFSAWSRFAAIATHLIVLPVAMAASAFLPMNSQPMDVANPYGLDSRALGEIAPGDYLHTRWGVWQATQNIPKQTMPHIKPEGHLIFDASSVDLDESRYFLLRSISDPHPISIPRSASWTKPLLRFPGTDLDGDIHLFRELHFPVSLRDVDGTTLGSQNRKLIVLVHGWNPRRLADAYSSGPFHDLKNAIYSAIKGSDWRVLTYRWEPDAATGPPILEGLSEGIINASEAAHIGHAHGVHLGARLMEQTPEIEQIQFVAHSAGAWVARAAAKMLVSKVRNIQIQITLLDPFVPGSVDSSSSLVAALLDDLSSLDRKRVVRLENYYTVDLVEDLFSSKISEWNRLGMGGPPTAVRFKWDDSKDHQQDISSYSVAQEGSHAVTTPAVVTGEYRTHGGAVRFYADSILLSPKGRTGGWALSLFRRQASDSSVTAPTQGDSDGLEGTPLLAKSTNGNWKCWLTEAESPEGDSGGDVTIAPESFFEVFDDENSARRFIDSLGGLPPLPQRVASLVARQSTPEARLYDAFIQSDDRKWVAFRVVAGDWRDNSGAWIVGLADRTAGVIHLLTNERILGNDGMLPNSLPLGFVGEELIVSNSPRLVAVSLKTGAVRLLSDNAWEPALSRDQRRIDFTATFPNGETRHQSITVSQTAEAQVAADAVNQSMPSDIEQN